MRCHSYDLLTRQIVDEIDFPSWRFGEVLDLPGGFSVSLPSHDEKCAPDIMAERRHAIIFSEGPRIWFGGAIWEVKVSQDRKTFTAGGEGLWSYFRDGRRNIRQDFDWSNGPDQFQIVTLLMAVAQAGVGENLGLTVRYPSLSGVPRVRKIKATERKAFAQVVEDFATADDGFDFAITAEWVNDQPALYLDLFHPERGTTLDSAWELGTHVEFSEDWTRKGGANLIDGIGQSSSGAPILRSAIAAPTTRIRTEKVVSYTDVDDGPTLKAFVNGALKRENKPVGTANVIITDHDECGLGKWAVGDTVRLVGDIGYTQLSDLHRIMGYDASGDNNGALKLTVDLEPA